METNNSLVIASWILRETELLKNSTMIERKFNKIVTKTKSTIIVIHDNSSWHF